MYKASCDLSIWPHYRDSAIEDRQNLSKGGPPIYKRRWPLARRFVMFNRQIHFSLSIGEWETWQETVILVTSPVSCKCSQQPGQLTETHSERICPSKWLKRWKGENMVLQYVYDDISGYYNMFHASCFIFLLYAIIVNLSFHCVLPCNIYNIKLYRLRYKRSDCTILYYIQYVPLASEPLPDSQQSQKKSIVLLCNILWTLLSCWFVTLFVQNLQTGSLFRKRIQSRFGLWYIYTISSYIQVRTVRENNNQTSI